MGPSQIPVTHVGSLVRPDDLVALLRRKHEGEVVDQRDFDELLDREVGSVVAQQAAAGVDIVSDGEFGKDLSWSQYVLERLSGFVFRPADTTSAARAIGGKDRRDFSEFYNEYERERGVAGMGVGSLPVGDWVVSGPVTYSGHEHIGGDIDRLQRAVDHADVAGGFLPVVAPSSVVPARIDEHYSSEEECLFAIAEALREEYRAIIDAGLTLQIDDAYMASMYDVMVPPKSLEDFRRWAATRVEAVNHAVAGLPPERIRYHVCWGSWNGPHTNDVPLADIIDLVLRIDVGGYMFEMANPRHAHEWKVWRDVELPEGKVLFRAA